MAGLFSLPPEVRDLVYAECLVVGQVFPYSALLETNSNHHSSERGTSIPPALAWDAFWPRPRLKPRGMVSTDYVPEPVRSFPDTALLLACKTIHVEAEPILYQRNQFVLSSLRQVARFFERSLHNGERQAWIKMVILRFDDSDIIELGSDNLFGQQSASRKGQIDNRCTLIRLPHGQTLGDFTGLRHGIPRSQLIASFWPRKASYVLDLLHLQKIVVDLTHARCYEGCCWLHKGAVLAMEDGFALGLPNEVTILGAGPGADDITKIIGTWTAMRLSASPSQEMRAEINTLRVRLDIGVDIDDISISAWGRQ